VAEPTEKNLLLIRRREAMGWGQKQLALRMREAAERRGISLAGVRTLISEICRWENGRVVPNGLHRMLLREVLGAETDAELGFASRQGDGIVWDPMHRRRFLAHLAAIPLR
jgi:transcriptional regulator with XRE-family HTH domain